eukprot:IDg17385t1
MPQLAVKLEYEGLPRFLWLVGDEAYSAAEEMAMPTPKSQCTEADRNLNYFSHVLKNVRVVCCAMKLHNYAIEQASQQLWAEMSPYEQEELAMDARRWYVAAKEAHDELQLRSMEDSS